MKIRPKGAELFHAEIYDEVNSRFSKFCERAWSRVRKYHKTSLIYVTELIMKD